MLTIEAQVAGLQAAFRWNEAELDRLLNGPSGPVARDLARRAIRVEGAAKQNATGPPGPNVRTGRLRGSITWRLGRDDKGVYADVGSNVEYACVFGANTSVITDRGIRTIGQLQPGERVLTQTGDFREVIAKSAFPAIEKPDLVDIEVEWRADRSHRLTLTLDHKVLVRRDGRNLWVCAGDLRRSDLMYDRVKQSPAKGTGPLKTCEWCSCRHRKQGKRYCSIRCRDLAWASGLNPHIGRKRSEATRKVLREAAIARGSGIAMNRRLAERGHRTSCEARVEEWLATRGVAFEREIAIGQHVVDFFLPNTREVFEADGAYWHRDQQKDIERDREILDEAPGVQITHLHFFDARFSPEIEWEPIPGARYVVCNPGPRSFVDPDTFRPVPVTTVSQWRYGNELRKPKASKWVMLYDVAVEGVHSFLASGVIVSNSYVELGTSRMAARPFLRPSLEAAR